MVTQIETFEKQIDDAQKVIDGAAAVPPASAENTPLALSVVNAPVAGVVAPTVPL